MNSLENWFCATALWRKLTEQKWLPWLLEGTDLGEHVFELGAGPGAGTVELLRRSQRVTSLEYSHKFCIALRSNNTVANFNVVQGDASALPFGPHTFTSAIAVLVLHHLRSVEAQNYAFNEIYRVLKPGGVFAALDIDDGWLPRFLHIGSTFLPVPADQLGKRMAAAGFSNINVERRPGGFRVHAVRGNDA
jgi:ubiquinone/menaquinone biosynthesis C-methylase UbiE